MVSNAAPPPSGYEAIDTPHGSALVRLEATEAIARIDSVIFDMDGVLLDVGESIQRVHGRAAELFFGGLGWTRCESLVSPSDVDAFKLAGRFNCDWDVAYAWQLIYLVKSATTGLYDGGLLREAAPTIADFTARIRKRGGGLDAAYAVLKGMTDPGVFGVAERAWDREQIRRLFIESYAGDLSPEVYGIEPQTVTGPGLIHFDRAILDPTLLPTSLRYGIATGRTRGEAAVAIRLMGWGAIFAEGSVITEDDGALKPDPRVLEMAVRGIAAERPLYVGDTPDDLLTAQRYSSDGLPLLTCMVMTGHSGEENRGSFIRQNVDIVADNVNAALVAVARLIGGNQ